MPSTFKQKRNDTEQFIARLIHEALDSDEGKSVIKKRKALFFSSIFAGITYFTIYLLAVREIVNVFFELLPGLEKARLAFSTEFYAIFLTLFINGCLAPRGIFFIFEKAFSLLTPSLALCALYTVQRFGFLPTINVSLTWAIVPLIGFIVFFSLHLVYIAEKKKELSIIAQNTAPYYTIPCVETNEASPYVLNCIKNISYLHIAHAIAFLLLSLTLFIPFIKILGERISVFTFLKESVQKYILRQDDKPYFFLELYFLSFEGFATKLRASLKLSVSVTKIASGVGFALLFSLGMLSFIGLFYGISQIFNQRKTLGSLSKTSTDCICILKMEILQRAAKTKEVYFIGLPLRILAVLLKYAIMLAIIVVPAYLYYQFYMGLTDEHGGIDEGLYSVSPFMLFIPLLFYVVIVFLPTVVIPYLKNKDQVKSLLWNFPLLRNTMWSKYQKRL